MTSVATNPNDMANVYLVPKTDGSWKTQITNVSPAPDAALLTKEGAYPVKVYYSRIDLNGSSSIERDICHNRSDLVQTLNWIGQCGHPLLSLWDYDHNKPISQALIKVLNSSYDRGFQQREQALMSMEEDMPCSALETLISNAEDKSDMVAFTAHPDRAPDR